MSAFWKHVVLITYDPFFSKNMKELISDLPICASMDEFEFVHSHLCIHGWIFNVHVAHFGSGFSAMEILCLNKIFILSIKKFYWHELDMICSNVSRKGKTMVRLVMVTGPNYQVRTKAGSQQN